MIFSIGRKATGMASYIAVTFALLMLSSLAMSQAVITVGDGAGPAGGAAVSSIDWVEGNSVAEIQIEILYDDTVLTPQNDGGAPANVNGCLDNLASPHGDSAFSACVIASAGRVVLTINSNFTFDLLTTQNIGTITWDIDGGATVPSIEALVANELDVTLTDGSNPDPATTFTAEDGEISIVDVSAVLNVTPANINFGNQQTGTTSAPQTATVSNDGTDGIDLEITSLTVGGDFAIAAGGSCTVGTVLADTETCTVDVEFSPTVDGVASDSLVVGSDAATVTNDTVGLEGTGVPGPQSTLTVTPDPMAFGVVDLGNLPVTDTFVAENTGDAGSSLTISAFSLAGDAEFSVGPGGDNCTGATLNDGDTCTVEIEFDSAANGVFAATGSFASDADVGANQDIAITGEADSVPDLVANPAFGPISLGLGPAGSTQTANGSITNNGSAPGDYSCVLGGPDAAIFSTNPAPLSGTVAADETDNFSLSCDIPPGSVDGDTFNATLTCTGDIDGTYELSCGTQSFTEIPVPTMQPWALALFALMMLIVGGFSIRFFRAS